MSNPLVSDAGDLNLIKAATTAVGGVDPSKLIKIDAGNLADISKLIAAGQTLFVVPAAPTGYVRRFQHQDWVDFVDPVQAGGDNGVNGRFHALESEFDLISAAITSVDSAVSSLQGASPAIGLTLVPSISDGATIPVPSGFLASETKFFAFVKYFAVEPGTAGATGQIGFNVYADNNGKVTATHIGAQGSILATGMAIAKRGGW